MVKERKVGRQWNQLAEPLLLAGGWKLSRGKATRLAGSPETRRGSFFLWGHMALRPVRVGRAAKLKSASPERLAGPSALVVVALPAPVSHCGRLAPASYLQTSNRTGDCARFIRQGMEAGGNSFIRRPPTKKTSPCLPPPAVFKVPRQIVASCLPYPGLGSLFGSTLYTYPMYNGNSLT